MSLEYELQSMVAKSFEKLGLTRSCRAARCILLNYLID